MCQNCPKLLQDLVVRAAGLVQVPLMIHESRLTGNAARALVLASAQASDASCCLQQSGLACCFLQRKPHLSLHTMTWHILAAMAHAHAARNRRGDEPRKPRGPDGSASDGKAAYLADVKSSSSQMKRPSGGASLSWRLTQMS